MSTWSCSCVSSGCEAWTHRHTDTHTDNYSNPASLRMRAEGLIGERERANLVVQLARFFYVSICPSCRSDDRCRSTVYPSSPIFTNVSDFFLRVTCRNVLRISKYTTNEILHHAVIMGQRVLDPVALLLWATQRSKRSCRLFMQAINVFMQAVNAFMQAVNSMSMRSCRLPVLSDLLVWFSTHCTDANRRETMPKQH